MQTNEHVAVSAQTGFWIFPILHSHLEYQSPRTSRTISDTSVSCFRLKQLKKYPKYDSNFYVWIGLKGQ